MNKKQVIEEVAKRTGTYVNTTTDVLESFFSLVSEELEKGEDVQIRYFGKFYVHEAKEKIGRNLIDNTPITIPARLQPKFKASKELKQRLIKK